MGRLVLFAGVVNVVVGIAFEFALLLLLVVIVDGVEDTSDEMPLSLLECGVEAMMEISWWIISLAEREQRLELEKAHAFVSVDGMLTDEMDGNTKLSMPGK